jgi:hypothetical protein
MLYLLLDSPQRANAPILQERAKRYPETHQSVAAT